MQLTEQNTKIRWGILGTAWIVSERLGAAIRAGQNAQLLAIASRDEKKAAQFARTFDIPRSYGSYQELLNDREIDAVYIPLPNHLHKEWAVRATEAGKHVFCEKPAALYSRDVEEMTEACRKNGVKFTEGYAFPHHPMWQRLKEIVTSGEIGRPLYIHVHYGIPTEDKNNIRLSPIYGGGALNDVGCYCMYGLLSLLGKEPEKILAQVRFAQDGIVDLTDNLVMRYPDDLLVHVECSIETSVYNQHMELYGSKGTIKIELPFKTPEMLVQIGNTERAEKLPSPVNIYTAEIQDFCECIINDRAPLNDPALSVANMKVIERIRQAFQNK